MLIIFIASLLLMIIAFSFNTKKLKELSTDNSVVGWKTSPFEKEFYTFKPLKVNVYCTQYNLQQCKQVLKDSSKFNFNYVLNLLDDGSVDVALLPKFTHKNFNYVKDLKFNKPACLLLIASNDFSKLHDLNDIVFYKDIKIKTTDLLTEKIIKDILTRYPKQITNNISEIGSNVDNPAIYAILSSHPNKEINRLLNVYTSLQKTMHLITINKIINDDKFLNEKYEKTSFDIFKYEKFYPGLTKLQDNSTNYNTLSVKYAFYVHFKSPFKNTFLF